MNTAAPAPASLATGPVAAPVAPFVPQIRLYQDWLARERGLHFESYHDLWRWSTTELDAFWQSIWDYFALQSPTPHSAVLARNVMPGAQWFPGARVNYARQVFRHVAPAHAAGFAAIISENEKGQVRELAWPELRRQVAALALQLQARGVQPGDRVAAYLPNVPEAMVAFLATVSIGAVWSICAPDMGTRAVLDRFRQIEPKVLIACDGVTYAGRDIDRMAVVQELKDALPSVEHVIVHANLGTVDLAQGAVGASALLADLLVRDDEAVHAFEPMWLPFDHPLWIVYSSGTTGLPKPIVHGHGGTLVVALALKILHNDVGCSYQPNSWGERFHWYSSTGWVMWNAQLSGLLNGTTCVIFDGSPAGPRDRPDWTTLWRFAARHKVTFFGAGAAFFANCQKAGIELADCGDLSRVRALGTTGSPLSAETQRWGTAQMHKVWQAHGRADMPTPSSAAATSSFATAMSSSAMATSSPGSATSLPGAATLSPGMAASFPVMAASFPVMASEAKPSMVRHGLRPRDDSQNLRPRDDGQNLPPRDDGNGFRDEGDRSSASDDGHGQGPCHGEQAPADASGDIWWCNISGGTDFAGAFIGGHRELPQAPGVMQCRLLGCAVEAWNEAGEAVTGEVGELVCTQPIPSMPLYFWNDPGNARYLASYFEMYPPGHGRRPGGGDGPAEMGGVWRHGDWLRIGDAQGQGEGCVIFGRSDATINRHGLRMGTSELYSAVEALPEVLDSMVVDLEYLGKESYMPLFVVLREGFTLDQALHKRIHEAIKTALSPRFIPNEIFQVAEIPRTLSGKKQELPIKKLMLGHPLEKVVNRDAMANPGCLDWYVTLAQRHLGKA